MNSKPGLLVVLLRVNSPTSNPALTACGGTISSHPKIEASVAELKEEKAFASELLADVL
jgi:hypothetical protein